MAFQIETAHRPVVMGTNGAVTCGHPLASLAGIRILERGGSAVDAIVAMAAAVGVVEPNMSGVGGDGFTLVYDASVRRVFTVNGSGPAPNGATVDFYRDGIPGRGPLSASVPGAVSGWATMHQRWGRLDFREVLEPAATLATDGFPVYHNYAVFMENVVESFRKYPSGSAVFLPHGRVPPVGSVLKQFDLGNTLREIGETGGESFYRGSLADRISRAVQEDGGLIDTDSLAAFRAEIVDPLSAPYRGLTVFEPDLNSTGHVLLQELVMTGLLDLSDWKPGSAELIHHMVEIKKLAFEDRERFAGDPRFVGALPPHLLTAEYALERLSLLDPQRTREQVHADQSAGGDTTYLAAADRDGNVASMTTSINGIFGACYVPGDTGVLLNCRMPYWHLEAGHPNMLEPGKRVRHTVSPAILLNGDQPAVAIGTPGADGQVQTMYQVLVNLLDYGMNPQEAVEYPRWQSFVEGQGSNWPHTGANALLMERGFKNVAFEGLQRRGHLVTRIVNPILVGSVQLIQIDRDRGVFSVGSDPRRDAYGLAM